MSPEVDARQKVLSLAHLAVQKAARDGGMIPAHTLAVQLLADHPDCPMSFEELRDGIARVAIEHGVGVEFGERS